MKGAVPCDADQRAEKGPDERLEGKAYILKKREAKSLFTHITRQLAKTPCDHTLTHARAWLEKKFPDGARHDAIIREWQEDGGGCDCEIILNCYERYELDG